MTAATSVIFAIGDLVEKIGGRSGGPGRIVGVTEDMGDGYRLYSVAMKVEGGYGEFVHVFPATVLRPAAQIEASPLPRIGSDVINDAGWIFVAAMPEPLPGPIFNNLKPALYMAICHVLKHWPGPSSDTGRAPVLPTSISHLARADRFDFSTDKIKIWVERRGPDAWVLSDGHAVMNTQGEWELEPQPSSRSDEFLARTRFSLAVAVQMARSIIGEI